MSDVVTDNALRKFCDYYGFDDWALTGADPYRIVNAGPDFAGRIDAIRLTENGRFGNIFYQILHCLIVARQLRCRVIELFQFAGGPARGRYDIAGFEFRCGVEVEVPRPTLVGHFFNSYAFQTTLSGFEPEVALELIDEVMRPLFGHLMPAQADRDDKEKTDEIVLNFRGGDIFAGDIIHEWYVQPPASYYVKAALEGRTLFDVRRAVLVAEDRTNPAIPIVERELAAAGLSVVFTQGELVNDLRVILTARHLVSPFGTMCEAAAMLSTRLVSYFAFRQFESHRHLHPRRPALVARVLAAHGVRLFRINDPARDYTPHLTWKRNAEQLDLMATFPMARLKLQDLGSEPDVTDDRHQDYGLIVRVNEAAEASRMRALIVDLRDQIVNLSSRMAVAEHAIEYKKSEVAQLNAVVEEIKNSMSWTVTAPLRWVRRFFGRNLL